MLSDVFVIYNFVKSNILQINLTDNKVSLMLFMAVYNTLNRIINLGSLVCKQFININGSLLSTQPPCHMNIKILF